MRARVQQVRVSLRTGLNIVIDRTLPLTGAFATAGRRPRHDRGARPGATARSFRSLDSFFSAGGLSLVAGRAALIPAGAARPRPPRTPRLQAQRPCCSTADACCLPARCPREETSVPVVSIPAADAAKVLAGIAAGGATCRRVDRRRGDGGE